MLKDKKKGEKKTLQASPRQCKAWVLDQSCPTLTGQRATEMHTARHFSGGIERNKGETEGMRERRWMGKLVR